VVTSNWRAGVLRTDLLVTPAIFSQTDKYLTIIHYDSNLHTLLMICCVRKNGWTFINCL